MFASLEQKPNTKCDMVIWVIFLLILWMLRTLFLSYQYGYYTATVQLLYSYCTVTIIIQENQLCYTSTYDKFKDRILRT